MSLALLRFELRYHLQHISFAFFALCLFFFGYVLAGANFGEANLYRNSTYNITLVTGLLSLGAIFCMMILAARVLLRDQQHHMEELVFATPIAKRPFLLARFGGFYLASLLLFCLALSGLWLGTLFSTADPEQFGPILAGHYLWPLLTLAAPNLLLIGAVLFIIAGLSRNVLATYVGGVLLYSLYWLAAMFLNSPMIAGARPASPEGLALAALLDPIALSAFFEQTRYWEVMQKNTASLALSGHFLYNRLLWLAVSGLLLFVNYVFFRFRKTSRRGGRQKVQEHQVPGSLSGQFRLAAVQPAPIAFWQPLSSNFRLEFRQIIRSVPFLVVLLIWVGVVSSEILTRIHGGGEYSTDLYPTTNLLIRMYADPFPFLSILLIIFYAGEIAHREQGLGVHELKDSLPVGNSVFFLSKYLALISVPLLLLGVAILIAIGCQLAGGWWQLELGQYLTSLYLLGLPSCLFAILALSIQTITPNKYLGMFLSLVFHLVLTSSLSHSIGIHHPLLKAGAFPEVSYSNMSGYNPLLRSFHWTALYWGSFYLLLALLSVRLWRRGTAGTLKNRLQQLKKNWSVRSIAFAIIIAAAGLSIGAFLFYQFNILGEYQSPAAMLDQRADYEKKYKGFADLPELNIASLKSQADLYPSQHSYRFRQTFVLENRNPEAVSELWFTVSPLVAVSRFELEGGRLKLLDSLQGVYWFQLEKALPPGGQLRMQYDIVSHRQYLPWNPSAWPMEIIPNGTNIMHPYTTPSFGYRYELEIGDESERKKRGLPPLEKEPEALHAGAGEAGGSEGAQKFPFETIISTETGETAIAPGKLLTQWEKQGRQFFHYRTEQPMGNFYTYLSAAYQRQQRHHGGISLEVYYAAGHDRNVPLMLEVMEQSLAYCREAFSDYPLQQLRLAEIPDHWGMGGFATPGLIALVENRSFFTDLRDKTRFDVVTKRVAHEVAHQWFGHQVSPPTNTPGATMIVESLAKYIECVMIDRRYGKGQLRKLLNREMQTYFTNRNRSDGPEEALARLEEQSFIAYTKGAIVMNALRDLLGETQFNEVIRNFIACYAYPRPSGTAADFVELLKAAAPDSLHPRIDDWMYRIPVYDTRVEEVHCRQLPDGRYEIQARIWVGKSVLQADGQLQDQAFTEPITVGFFQQHPDQLGKTDQPVHLQAYPLHAGENELQVVLDQRPGFIAIDPYLHLPDKNTVDNVRQISQSVDK